MIVTNIVQQDVDSIMNGNFTHRVNAAIENVLNPPVVVDLSGDCVYG
jgi:hypothetical protein